MDARVEREANDVADALARRLQVRARGRADGAADRPGPDATEPSAAEIEIRAAVEALAGPATAKAEAFARDLAATLASRRPQFGAETSAIDAGRISVRQAAGRLAQEFADADEQARATGRDLAAFRHAHRRTANAHYPSSTLLAGGLLACAALFEALFSATLFAQEDARGLLGGAATAVGLSGANVAIGFLGGFLGLRYIQHVRPWLKAAGAACFLVALAAGIGLNGFAALWRQSLAESAHASAAIDARGQLARELERCLSRAGVERSEQSSEANARVRHRRRECEAQRAERLRLASGGASLQDRLSPQAVVLLMLGLGVWVFSALKGYSGFDDPYPDYGKIDRMAKAAREERDALREDARAALEEPLNEAKDAAQKHIDQHTAAVAAMRRAYDAAAGQALGLQAQITKLRDAETQLIGLYREENRSARRTPAPAYFISAPAPHGHVDPLAAAGAILREAEDGLTAAQAKVRAGLEALSAEVEQRYAALLAAEGASVSR